MSRKVLGRGLEALIPRPVAEAHRRRGHTARGAWDGVR